MPKYVDTANDLRDRIAAGEFPIGSKLPGITDLQSHYGVALNTVRAAEELLREEGLLRIAQGEGAFVIAAPGAAPVDVLGALYAARDAVAVAIAAVERQQKKPRL
ncbi:GntR family transcriptional regulator [Micromonospora sp. RL09-050-HVF-A]|uniref:GntR family transcriptional regulator n=1 Tax=Micromonospora sp. RL09-050-HVF-A TaxID=1703433 RepID=UPI0027E259CC|nr:GntR family transcriptional regulator [Micromonospora sp. RL09-050-HVF-A]